MDEKPSQQTPLTRSPKVDRPESSAHATRPAPKNSTASALSLRSTTSGRIDGQFSLVTVAC
jgi:hypothetical protein